MEGEGEEGEKGAGGTDGDVVGACPLVDVVILRRVCLSVDRQVPAHSLSFGAEKATVMVAVVELTFLIETKNGLEKSLGKAVSQDKAG